MNTILAINIAQEHVIPAYAEDGSLNVGLFQNNQLQFCVPVKTEQEALNLAVRLQEMFVAAIQRYRELGGD